MDISNMFCFPKNKGFPDLKITIGMAFEVDGLYEDFGYIALYENIPFAEGRNLERLYENMAKYFEKLNGDK